MTSRSPTEAPASARGSTTPPSPWVNTSPDSHSGPATTASRRGMAWPSRRSTSMPCQLPYMEGRISSLKPVSTSTKWLLPAFLVARRSEEHTSELQSPCNLVCRLLLEKKKDTYTCDGCL